MTADDDIRNAAVNAATAVLAGGTALFREGSTTLLTFSLKSPAFGAAAAGAALLDTTTPDMSATASGAAAVALDNYQFRSSDLTVRLSGDIGETGSGAEIEINHAKVLAGDVVDFTDFELSIPAES